MFSSRSFTVLGLTFKSLIYFELIFVSDIRQGSDFILLHVNIQFSKYHLLKTLSIPHWVFLASLSYISCIFVYAWANFWAFNYVSLFCMLQTTSFTGLPPMSAHWAALISHLCWHYIKMVWPSPCSLLFENSNWYDSHQSCLLLEH